MAIRVTQHTMYNNMVGGMQKNLGAYMESIEQGSTQKRINRPSDDPAGTYRVLTTRVDMTNTEQYQENVDTALGWLKLADSILSTSVPTAITGLKALAEQASTGTYTAEQRKIMADQAREYFGQLLNLANTEFEGKSIFGGHIYDKNAFEQGLAVTSWDKNWESYANSGVINIEGASASTVLIQFDTDNPGGEEDLKAGTKYRWSNDAGATWQEGTVGEEGDNFLIQPAGSGVSITIPKTIKQIAEDGTEIDVPVKVTGAQLSGDLSETSASAGANNGTMLYIRPTAFYQGDDNDPPVDVSIMGTGGFDASAVGDFGKNVLVRIDGQDGGNVDLNTEGKEFSWSYSTDGGNTWVEAKGKTTGEGSIRLPIPGGYVTFEGNELPVNDQILVHPSRANLEYEIMKDTYISVNGVGKDIFGGYYEGKPSLDGDNNLFEVVGAFIGYLEGNNQEGCQKTLAALTVAEQQVLAEATRIGGLENRLDMAKDVLSYEKIDQQERLSYVEDIDLTELLTKLTRQQLTYQTVLQSSSMIMQLSLAKYI